jgi:hypothetical protein
MLTTQMATGVPPSATDAATPRKQRLGEILLGQGMITQSQLEEALRVQRTLAPGKRLGQILVEQEVLTRQQLTEVLGRELTAQGSARRQLGGLLVEAGVIDDAQLGTALAFQRRTGLRLGEALLQLDLISEGTLREVLCAQLGVAFVDPRELHVHPGLGSVISRKYAQRHRVVPISQVGNALTVVMADPSRVDVVRELAASTGSRIVVVTTTLDAFQRAFSQVYG